MGDNEKHKLLPECDVIVGLVSVAVERRVVFDVYVFEPVFGARNFFAKLFQGLVLRKNFLRLGHPVTVKIVNDVNKLLE